MERTQRRQRGSKPPKFISVQGSDNNPRHKHDCRGIKIRVVSYNVLAQAYTGSYNFRRSPRDCLRWNTRSVATIKLLRNLDADFLCLQEVDEYDSFYKGEMEGHGYSGIYVQRNRDKRDGSAIFYKPNCAELLLQEHIEYNDLMDLVSDDQRWRLERDCVGIMAAFKIKGPSHQIVIVANTHLYWNPKYADVKMAQAKYLLSRIAKFRTMVSEKYKCISPVILTGDFNSTPVSKVYQYLVSSNQPSEMQSKEEEEEEEEEAPILLNSVYGVTVGEPRFTNHVPGFTETLDYIFFTPSVSIKPLSVMQLPDAVRFLPNFKHPSDHLPIAAEFAISDL